MRLKSLYFGDYIFPARPTSFDKLADVSYIGEIRIDNSSHLSVSDGASGSGLLPPGIPMMPPIAFDIFEPPNCPRLRRFTANHNSDEVFCFLRKFGTRPLTVMLDTSYQRAPEKSDPTIRTFNKGT